MTHIRNRHAESLIGKALTYSPCVGLIGMRQVGKSTLLNKYGRTYHTFDDDRFLVRFENEGHGILETSPHPLALDEIQKCPPAFDALKLSIDQLKKTGRFLVSGSVRFGSRRQIRESLTGRILLIELLPFTLAECHHRPPSTFLKILGGQTGPALLQALSKNAWADEKLILHYRETGGLPGICFRRDPAIRSDLLAAHLETLLARDIQLVKKTTLSVNKLLLLLAEIARTQGLPVNLSHLARIVGVSTPTIRSILDALQALFLIRPYGHTWFVEDSGISSHLVGAPADNPINRRVMSCLVQSELRTQIGYQFKREVFLKPYQTRGGIDIPFMVEFKGNKKVAMIVEEEDIPSNKALKSLSWARKRLPGLIPLILLRTQKPFETSTGIPCLPWTWVF